MTSTIPAISTSMTPTTETFAYTRHSDVNVSIRTLIGSEREIYKNYPAWQRSHVWPEIKKRRLIQTLLRGRYLPALVCYPSITPGDERRFILDGQQRQEAIFEYIQNGFSIAGKAGYYSELSDEARARLHNYTVKYSLLHETDEKVLREIYRSLQNAVPLNSSETLYSYLGSSRFSDLAAQVLEQPFFREIYAGNISRKEDYQAAFYPIAVELAGGPCHMDTARLNVLASGAKDDQITDSLPLKIDETMLLISHLFKGAKITSRSMLIIMYEAVFFLLKAGYDLYASEEGVLTPWIKDLGAERSVYGADLMKMYQNKFQEIFWQQHLHTLTGVPGLVGSQEEVNNLGALASWIYNRYTCPTCKGFSRVNDVFDHSFGVFTCQVNEE